MTEVGKVYDAFLAKMLDDEWANWTEEELKQDLIQLLKEAISWFKFPKNDISLNNSGTYFNGDLTEIEIQILATRMKCEWLNRSILTWERIKPLYEERDFSEANMLDKLNTCLANEIKRANKLESNYYRAINYKPFDYTKLAGG